MMVTQQSMRWRWVAASARAERVPALPTLILRMAALMHVAVATASSSSVRRRGAFDIGSGAIKLLVGDVDVGQQHRVVQTYFGEERPCAFGADFLKSPDGVLSSAIQDHGLSTLRALKQIGDELGCQEYAAVATAVFRKANNGEAFLHDAVKGTLGVRNCVIVSQELEAQLGHATAVAVSGVDAKDCVAWDSGGGSFQISRLGASSSSSSSSSSLDMYMGAFGSGLAHKVRSLSMHSPPPPSAVPLTPLPASRHVLCRPSWRRCAGCRRAAPHP